VLGATVTGGGAGFSLGPLVVGATAARFGTLTPFAAIAAWGWWRNARKAGWRLSGWLFLFWWVVERLGEADQ
jgi:hypothetical protein